MGGFSSKRLRCARVGLALATILEACGRDPAALGTPTPSSAARAHVRFTQERITLSVLESGVRPPVSIGSTTSPATLTSDAPEVVSVTADGSLVAHRNGDARISGPDGAWLAVSVQTTRTLSLVPGEQRLGPGESAPVRVLGEGGQIIDPAAVQWLTSDPAAATIQAGRVVAGSRTGRVHLVAEYGGLRADGFVYVRAKAADPLAFRVAPPRLRRGELGRYELSTTTLDASWSSSNRRVVSSLGGGAVQAKHAGWARICARAGDHAQVCTKVEVIP